MARDDRSRRSVEVAERYADGAADDAELRAANGPARGIAQGIKIAAVGLFEEAFGYAAAAASHPVMAEAGYGFAHIAIRARCPLLRDIFGNPFRPVSLDPAWLTPNVVDLARTVYEERELPSGELDRTRLAVLADALMDAGCDSDAILSHLRGSGPHVRGCWVVDLLLGKE